MEPGPTTPSPRGPTVMGRAGAAMWIVSGVLAFSLAGVLVLFGLSSAISGLRPPTESGVLAGTASGASDDAVARTDLSGGRSPETGFAVWAVNDDGLPVRWDPCRPIEVVLSPVGAPASAAADLDEALARISAVSGLDLVRTGATDERPSGSRLPYQPERYGRRWAPILVAWARPGDAGLPLRDTDRGVSIPIAGGPEGNLTFLTAQVILNRDRTDLVAGFGDRADAWGATLLHELLHALGLDHVDDPDELMAVYPGSGPVILGSGDLAGIDAIGSTGGCRPVPTPGPLRVAPPASTLPGDP